jgi:hypothetical protein
MSVITHPIRTRWHLPPLADGLLPVIPWHDPITQHVGAPVDSPYLERFWLPILGPTSTWLLRHVDRHFETSPDGVVLDLAETSRALGLSPIIDEHCHVARAMNRCVYFGLAQPVGDVVAVRRWAPPLSHKSIQSLSPATRAAYRRWVNERTGGRRAGSRRR